MDTTGAGDAFTAGFIYKLIQVGSGLRLESVGSVGALTMDVVSAYTADTPPAPSLVAWTHFGLTLRRSSRRWCLPALWVR